MTLDQMRYFFEVAKTEHVGRAALALHVSPSTISHAVASLEREFGRPLFDKHGKHVRLTASGGLLRERVGALLLDIDGLHQDLKGEDATERRHLRFAATHLLSSTLLVPAWRSVSRSHRFTSVDLLSCRSADVVNRVLDGEVDLGVCFSPVEHPDVAIEKLTAGHLRLVTHRKHPLAKASASKVVQALAAFPCTMPKPLAGVEVCEVHPVLSSHGIQAAAQVRYDSFEAAAALLEDERTWSLVPELMVSFMAPQMVKLACPPTWNAPYSLCLVRRLVRADSKIVTALAHELLAMVSALSSQKKKQVKGSNRQ